MIQRREAQELSKLWKHILRWNRKIAASWKHTWNLRVINNSADDLQTSPIQAGAQTNMFCFMMNIPITKRYICWSFALWQELCWVYNVASKWRFQRWTTYARWSQPWQQNWATLTPTLRKVTPFLLLYPVPNHIKERPCVVLGCLKHLTTENFFFKQRKGKHSKLDSVRPALFCFY